MTRRLFPWLCSALTVFSGASAAGEVRAPFWGDALFHFYQAKDFQAITSLMASQQFARLPPHDDEAEALRAGLLLSYGLHQSAEAIFTRLAEQGSTEAMRSRAWYFLAKIRWQRGLVDAADQSLARIDAPLPVELEEERQLLAAQVQIARADYSKAAATLGRLAAERQPSPYARFNLGVALLRTGDATKGNEWLGGLGKMPAQDEEQRSLRDKANLALGFAALQLEQPAQARAHLQRVRLHGPYANKALLGFGWAAASLKQHALALVPWQELSRRDASDPAVLEARLAVPYALAELKAYGQAHDGYQQAIKAFDQEASALDQTVASLRQGALIDALIESNPGADLGWLWRAEKLPGIPHPAHLAPLVASHGFQEALKDQRDLRFLLGNLKRWSEDLGSYHDMLDNRRHAFADRLPLIRAEARKTDLAALQSRRDAVRTALDTTQADGAALANQTERAWQARLARVQATLAQLPHDDVDLPNLRDRASRVAGALAWQLARQFPARVWEARKSLLDIDAALVQAAMSELALAQAQREEPARFDQFNARIAALAQRLQQQIPVVTALQAEQQQALQGMAITALLDQKSRLAEYSAQARFAVAQLQDRATMAKVADHAPAR